MNYTLTQLARVEPSGTGVICGVRASVGSGSLLAAGNGLAGILGSMLLTIQYFVLLPPFAWLASVPRTGNVRMDDGLAWTQ